MAISLPVSFEAGLLEDALSRSGFQVAPVAGNGYFSFFQRMRVVVVTPSNAVEDPTVVYQKPFQFFEGQRNASPLEASLTRAVRVFQGG
jgi:hypothetical protein